MALLPPNLRAFVAVVRRGTVHAAAKELRLTQTGVTQRLRALEADLRTTLFLRSRKGMTLTQEGQALLRYCQQALELEGQTLSQISGAATERDIAVTVAGPTSVMTARIVPRCLHLYAEWPRLLLHFLVSDAPDRTALVRSGAATLAIVSPEQVPNEMASKLLKPDRYLLVGAPSWRDRRLTHILEHERIIDFDEADPTTLSYLRTFALVGHVRQPRLYVNTNEAIIRLFCAGVGFGTLTQEIARPYLQAGDLITLNGGQVMEDPLALVWYPRPQPPPYFTALLKALG